MNVQYVNVAFKKVDNFSGQIENFEWESQYLKVNSIRDGKVCIKDREISISRTGRQKIIDQLLGKTE